jgi:hypothetical protein
MELNKFENRRTFHTATTRQTVIRDYSVKQFDPPKLKEIKEEPIVEPIVEPTVDIKINTEPLVDEVIKETPKTKKRSRTKKPTK